MPITIKSYEDGTDGVEVAFLCDDVWYLDEQVQELDSWTKNQANSLPVGQYIVDVGYSPRPGAAGGSGTISEEALRIMAEKGMSLELSEYPPFE